MGDTPKHCYRTLIFAILIGAGILSAGTQAHAALFGVELIDNDGPHIKGTVNTSSDQFVITFWQENPGSIAYRTASDLPRTYPDVNASGGSFDVPDNWNGTIGNNWDFINPNSLPDAGYNEGTFFSGALAHDGWGGWITTSNTHLVAFNQTRWPVVPHQERVAATIDFDIVRVFQVPEPSSVFLAFLAVLAMIGTRRRSGRVAR